MDVLEELKAKTYGAQVPGWATRAAQEIERLRAENEALRTGDTCARQCEGAAYRIELRRLRHEIETLRPANWKEDPSWVRLTLATALTPNAEVSGSGEEE